jgi:ATP-citrate lyase alpha-subunit
MLFSTCVLFVHAGSSANAEAETAESKNIAMAEAGIHVPASFNDLPGTIQSVVADLTAKGIITEIAEPELKIVPKVRKAKEFICTISDDTGEEATYAGYPISAVATPETGFGIGDVISLLWFKKRYPKWATDFIETVIKTVADHGPAVSGAHNAKVTARAGKSVVEALVTGLLTIGPRFGGAIDGAAEYFKYADDNDLTPKEFLGYMKKKGIPIPGIGHRIKSLKNPDLRVTGLMNFAAEHFPSTPLLDYAKTVEALTTSKKENLILNVDGTIGILMVDMWRALGYSEEEINEFISSGTLNAFFIVGRSIGFIGHVLDEKRLAMPMYRHPMDDILYDVQKAEEI